MTLFEIIQIIAVVIEVLLLPSVIALVKILLNLHIDVRMLLDEMSRVRPQLAAITALEKRTDDHERRLQTLEERVLQ